MKKITGLLAFIMSGMILFAQVDQIQPMDNDGHVQRGQFTRSIEQASVANISDSYEWTSLGPAGGDVVDIAVDLLNSSRIFAAAGIPYVSEDGGSNWLIMENLSSIASGQITCIEANTNDVILAGGWYNYGKVYRSADGGINWSSVNLPINTYILDACFDPSDPDIAYLALPTNGSSSRVLLKSINAGSNWTALDLISALPNGFDLINIIVDPDNGQNLYGIGTSGFSDALVVASSDGGTSWTNISGNLPQGKPYNRLAMANGKLYMAGGQLFGGQSVGVYVTEDNGGSWQNISSSFPVKVSNFILIDPDNHDKLYVGSEGDGIYYSNDGGTNWNFDGTGAGENGSARVLAFEPGNSQVIYAGFLSLAVCKSTDAALNWEYANTGIATLLLNDIEVNPADPNKMFVSFEGENSGGCYMSNDGGQIWELVTDLPATRYSQVTYGADGSMYAWSNGPTTVAAEGLYKSTDGGLIWENTGPNIGSVFETQIFALCASETDPDYLLIGGNNFGANGWESMIYRTIDGGENWVNTYMGPTNDSFKYLSIDPNSEDEITYAAYKSESQGGFLKSIDGGVNWVPAMIGVPVGTKWCSVITVDPDNSDILYGGIGGYGFMPGSIFRSEHGGDLWEYANLELGTNNYAKITDIVLSPDNSGVIYAATSSNGVYLTSDTANSWSQSNDNLPASYITGLSKPFLIDEIWTLCASSYTNSAFITDIFIPEPVGIYADQQDNSFYKVYPNPSSGRIAIEMDKTVLGPAEVRIYNKQGQTVYEAMFQVKDENIIHLDLDLPAGIWILNISAGLQGYTEKIVIF